MNLQSVKLCCNIYRFEMLLLKVTGRLKEYKE